MTNSQELLSTVATSDRLGFFENKEFHHERVIKFLDLTKSELGRFTGVSSESIRNDRKLPVVVEERLLEIANILEKICIHFDGDMNKTALWYKTSNPLFGGLSARDMLRLGRFKKLLKIINAAMTGNVA